MSNQRTIVFTSQAPKPIGPYSQAVRAGNFLFCSGQTPLHPETGEIVGVDDIAAQTRRVLDNLTAVLAAGGASWATVVKTTIFLKDMNDFATVNQIYGERVGQQPPARATVEVSRLPKDVKIEIEITAMIP